ncbi:hypothetical protein PENPOL_c010G03975 [Penicillium polonicum]|uniref:Uncharacterized protein n=1 Tax=Penicillium polonicum TaxID=60169 RepID=A0A1V6NEG4_PENPO|nr:hypothetical protein PENPOL_c010G03975 [Penicillium polonicum]
MPLSDTCALGVARKSQTNSPIGKEIGTISYTFGNPSPAPALPYPAGYRHDLSLITDDNLPTLISPPGHPVVSEWTSYSTTDAYAVRMNTVVGRWLLVQGTIYPNAIRNATVIGTEYLWDRTARPPTML